MTTLDLHIQFTIALVGSLLGVLYQFSHNKTDAVDGYNIPVRLFSAFCGWFLTGLAQAYAINELHWNFLLITGAGFGIGLGIEKLIRLSMTRQNKAQSEKELIDIWKETAGQVMPGKPTHKDDQPPINDTQP